MRTGKHPRADRYRTHRTRIASVDARLAVQDLTPDDFGFQGEADLLHDVRRWSILGSDTDLSEDARPDLVDRVRARLFLLDLKCRIQIALREFRNACNERVGLGRRTPVPQGAAR